MRTRPLASLLVAVTLLGALQSAHADSVEDFYRGKTLNLMIGYTAGGGYDLYARLLARHIVKHIPGHPNVVPQNLTGAGSQRAAEFVYAVAPKDGTVFGTFGRTIAATPLLTPATAKFDGTKFTWIGSITNEVSTCITSQASKIKKWADALTYEATMGGEGPGSDPDVYTLLFKNVFGAKLRLVTGYHGTADVNLAMERGEVDGYCGLSWSTLKSRHLEAMQEKKINIIIQAALKKQPELADVPLASELTQDREKLQILKLLLASQEMARPFAAPPDIPPERAAALRKAFMDTMGDAEFLAEAEKRNMDVNPLPAKAIDDILAELYATPKAVVEKAAQAITK